MPSTEFSTTNLKPVASCVLCGGAQAVPWLQGSCPERPDDVFRIVECVQCGLRYVNPRPEGDALAAYYEQDYYSYVFRDRKGSRRHLKARLWGALGLLPPRAGGPGWRWRAARALVFALRGPRGLWALPAWTAGGRFFDVGGGAGERLDWAREMGWETYGLDISEAAVAVAAARGHRMVAGDARFLPYVSESMHCLTINHVLEHTCDPLQVLREVRRVLRPDGLAQVAVPNTASWSARLHGAHWRGLDLPRHLYHFTGSTLRQAVVTAGLRILSLKTLPDRWLWEETRKAAGEGPPSAREIKTWQQAVSRGEGENLEVWCVRADDHRPTACPMER